ncbi:fimbrial protein [uncultured Bacteroides sp.]|uniref:fimbrial protein n=1 Tax=uncultured Bacteroides sp. TaxID=162156 RepID=UPI0025D328A7|nr:DUF4906 domain-containing protein [uncultured Bacteroides sp.]
MKKQNNILAYSKLAFGFVLISILFFACQDDEIIKSNNVKEGIPVEVKFNMSVPEMATLTRGLEDEQEFQVNDLYLLIFDSKGQRKEGSLYYSTDDLIKHENGNQANPTKGILTVSTTSGKSYIFAAANVNSNELNGGEKLKEQLDAVQSINDFKKVTAMLSSKTEAALIDRTQAALVMCGAYVAKDASEKNEEGVCIIPDKGNNIIDLTGTIKLERLDSHITFNIKWGEVTSKVTSFELTEWKVYNVPVKSYLFAQENDAVGKKEKDDYAISPSQIKVSTDEDSKSCSFDFYMLENRKQAQKYDGRYLQSYAEREAEIKESNGGIDRNTGVYKYVEPYATYVEIKAKMELTSSKTNPDGKKVATVTYVIHLGGGRDDFSNFKSERNKKYAYNVVINDTEDIRVEVQEKDNERRPGVEGDVIDAETKVYTLDCHDNCFILGLTKKDADGLTFRVKTPFGTVDNESTTNGKEDYKWIRFKRNTGNSSNTLEKYPGYGEGLIDLFGLSADILGQSDKKQNDTIYYTVFVDEYYYNQAPAGQTWKEPYWKYFVNKEDRYVMLLFGPELSKDQESSYADAQYLITQRSIQTYYSTEHFNEDKTALGMEHINETGVPADSDPKIKTEKWSLSNGYYNMRLYIKNGGNKIKWDTHANLTTPNKDGYTFTMKLQSGWSACLSRNRDENGNGEIDPEEVKWYLPARDQLTGMFLGAESLTTPLFDADAHAIGTIKTGDAKYHYLLSNNEKFWSDEGCSIGGRHDNGPSPRDLRCVRNLNLDMNSSNADKEETKVKNVYTYNPTNHVFRIAQIDEKNIRGKVVNAELAIHDNFSSNNKPYKAFQMAKNFHIAEEGSGKWKEFVDIDSRNRSKCKTYYENNISEQGSWRTPNQREFMIMYTQSPDFVNYKKENGTLYRAYTRTVWKYNSNRHFGINQGILFLDDGQSFNVSLRCVRDVDADSQGNIIE